MRPSSSSLSTNRILRHWAWAGSRGTVNIDLDRRVSTAPACFRRPGTPTSVGTQPVARCPVAPSRPRCSPLEQRPDGDAVRAMDGTFAGHCASPPEARTTTLLRRSRGLGELEVILAADRALDHGHVGRLRPFLRVPTRRAEHDVGLPSARRRSPRPCRAVTCGQPGRSRRASRCSCISRFSLSIILALAHRRSRR